MEMKIEWSGMRMKFKIAMNCLVRIPLRRIQTDLIRTSGRTAKRERAAVERGRGTETGTGSGRRAGAARARVAARPRSRARRTSRPRRTPRPRSPTPRASTPLSRQRRCQGHPALTATRPPLRPTAPDRDWWEASFRTAENLHAVLFP